MAHCIYKYGTSWKQKWEKMKHYIPRHSLENVIQWWRHKAIKRYESLKTDGRLRTELEIWKRDNIDTIDIIR